MAVAEPEAPAGAFALGDSTVARDISATVAVGGELVREDIPSAAPVPTSAPAPVPTWAPPPERAPAPPPVELDWPADLVQVESDPSKIKAVEQTAPETPPVARPRRERPAPPPVNEEPLVQIETQRHDAAADAAGAKTTSGQAATTLPV